MSWTSGRARPAPRPCASGRTGRRERSRRSTSACSTPRASPRGGAVTASASCGCCGSTRRRSGWSIAATSAMAGGVTPTIQLVYARKGALKTRMGGKRFTVQPGEFVLLDNTRFYQMEMETAHEAVDLMMPLGWLDRYLPDPGALLGRPVSARGRLGRAARQPAGDDGRGDRAQPPAPPDDRRAGRHAADARHRVPRTRSRAATAGSWRGRSCGGSRPTLPIRS